MSFLSKLKAFDKAVVTETKKIQSEYANILGESCCSECDKVEGEPAKVVKEKSLKEFLEEDVGSDNKDPVEAGGNADSGENGEDVQSGDESSDANAKPEDNEKQNVGLTESVSMNPSAKFGKDQEQDQPQDTQDQTQTQPAQDTQPTQDAVKETKKVDPQGGDAPDAAEFFGDVSESTSDMVDEAGDTDGEQDKPKSSGNGKLISGDEFFSDDAVDSGDGDNDTKKDDTDDNPENEDRQLEESLEAVRRFIKANKKILN